MNRRSSAPSRLRRCMKAPLRVLCRARDLYVRSMTSCAGSIERGGGTAFDTGSLVEVLEAERMVLLGENACLGFRTGTAEEAQAVVAEWRRAAEMARAVVKLKEDHRVCLLGWKIEDLQAQIYDLERRNWECLEIMSRREKEK